MSTTLDVAAVVVPALTAAGGAWYGARLKFKQERKSGLAQVVDEAAQVLEVADQRRGAAYYIFSLAHAPLPPEGREALGRFRETLSQAAVLRDRLALSVETDTPVYKHYDAALEGLGKVSQLLGATAMYPDAERAERHLADWHQGMTEGEETFKLERRAFLDAAREHLG